MELNKALQLAVVQGWDDLAKKGLLSARIEYSPKTATLLEHLEVWAVKTWGDCDLIGDCWMHGTAQHLAGLCFWNGFCSAELTECLDFIMKNQDQFTPSAQGSSVGLELINPPTAENRIEARAWMKKIHDRFPKSFGAAA